MMQELDSRTNDGFTVSLLWNPSTNLTYIEVETEADHSVSTFPVAAQDCGDAFRHPFVYMPRDCGRGSSRLVRS